MMLPELATYLNKVTAEFQSLTKLGFKDPDGRVEPLKHYFAMRPLYYNSGFNHPTTRFCRKSGGTRSWAKTFRSTRN
jgi:hypothetical protein